MWLIRDKLKTEAVEIYLLFCLWVSQMLDATFPLVQLNTIRPSMHGILPPKPLGTAPGFEANFRKWPNYEITTWCDAHRPRKTFSHKLTLWMKRLRVSRGAKSQVRPINLEDLSHFKPTSSNFLDFTCNRAAFIIRIGNYSRTRQDVFRGYKAFLITIICSWLETIAGCPFKYEAAANSWLA